MRPRFNITKGVGQRWPILNPRGELANTCTPEQGRASRGQGLILDLPLQRRYLAKEMSARNILASRQSFRPREKRHRSHPDTAGPSPSHSELGRYYDALLQAHGAQNWWPGRTRFEVIVGAILTQSTSWANVERAIRKLRDAKLLTPAALERVPQARLAKLIRSSGYFRQKARKLKEFVHYLRRQHQGSLDRMFRTATAKLRQELLRVHALGGKRRTQFCYMPGSTQFSSWMRIPGGFWNDIGWRMARNRTSRFGECLRGVCRRMRRCTTNTMR